MVEDMELELNGEEDIRVDGENIGLRDDIIEDYCCRDESLLFFFLILAIFFQNGVLCTSKDSLLFFFLLLTIIMGGQFT